MTSSSGTEVARRTIAALAAVAVALLAGVAPSSAAPSTSADSAAAPAPSRESSSPSERPTRVLVVGDSVMEGAAAAIPAGLPGREVLVDTEVSRSTKASVNSAVGQGTDWDVVVILLGHNDGGSPGVYQPPYRRLLDHFADAPQVVVLTIHEVRPYYAEVNQFLRAEAADRTNVRVADWDATVSQTSGATVSDGLHLTGSGTKLMAGLIADRVVTEEEGAETRPVASTTTTAATAAEPTPTATEPGGLVPPIVIDQDPPATATTAAPPRGSALPVAIAARSVAGDGPDESDGAAPPAIWAGLVVATVASAAALRHVGRRFPA